uniref:rRNA adenine N(6)-methyltransferase n=1 Tax=Globisporangium ultimum (strain ATCC 200006 / CBS 805.95 / DAOM BR144) TaxID=431595 RepID=K3WT92_GLOUD
MLRISSHCARVSSHLAPLPSSSLWASTLALSFSSSPRATTSSGPKNVSHIQNTPHLKRKLGQHLLVSESILRQIVDAAEIPTLLQDKEEKKQQRKRQDADAVDAEDDTMVRILEIGPGTGNLTSALLNASPRVRVHAVEYDPRMVERLQERFKDEQERLQIEQKDFEAFEFANHALEVQDDDDEVVKTPRSSSRAARKSARLMKKSVRATKQDATKANRVHFDACVANIPYQLSSIIVSRLSNYMHKFPTYFQSAVLLVQEEFALRLLAKPGSQNYSRLSVNTALVADVTSVVKVGRGHFLPPPKVDSRVIKLVPVANRIVPPSLANEKLFFQKFDTMLRICFLRKNKTLRALLLSKTALAQIEVAKSLQVELLQAQKNEAPTVSEKDVISERIEAALNKCELSSSRAVQIPVDQFLKLITALEENGISFRPSTTRHFKD